MRCCWFSFLDADLDYKLQLLNEFEIQYMLIYLHLSSETRADYEIKIKEYKGTH